jgi:hypothetical protein
VGHEWSPDGTAVALHRRLDAEQSLWTLRRDAREPAMTAQFKDGLIRDFQWSTDSKSLVFTYGTSSQDVVLITDFQ